MRILITGHLGEGKTTVAKIIVKALEDEGIYVEKIIDEEYHSVSNSLQETRIKSIKNILQVEVESLNTVRSNSLDSRNTKNAKPSLFFARSK